MKTPAQCTWYGYIIPDKLTLTHKVLEVSDTGDFKILKGKREKSFHF